MSDFILVDNGTQWDLSSQERDYLVLQDMIYYCPDDNMYHTFAELDINVIDTMIERAKREVERGYFDQTVSN